MIPKTIHQFYAGAIPPHIHSWMETIRFHHPDWDVLLWDEQSFCDLGIGLDLNTLYFKCQNWASASNIIRLFALKKFGGIWIDTDCSCMKPLDPLIEYHAFCAFQDDTRICNAVVGADKNHPFINWQVERFERLLTADAATGVYLITEAPRVGVTVLPKEYFYPFDHTTPRELRAPSPESFLLHWWEGSWIK